MKKSEINLVVNNMYHNSLTPMFGLNKLVNYRNDDKYSQNLYRWLTYGKNKLYTNIFKETKGVYHIGLRDDNGIWMGARLMEVACKGAKAKPYSLSTSITKKWSDVTVKFWKRYIEMGKKGFPEIWF